MKIFPVLLAESVLGDIDSEILRDPFSDAVVSMIRPEVGRGAFPDGVLQLFEDLFLDAFSFQNRLSHAIERVSLEFHGFVVFEDVLSPLEVAFLHLPLGPGHGLRQHAGFQNDTFLEAASGQDRVDDLACEHLHQIVFKAEKESRGAVVTLSPRAPAQLIVDTA